MHANGTFEVKLTPQPPDERAPDAPLGRMLIDKRFSGDLDGVSVGQMLTGFGTEKGSAGYVAIERVTGTLQGKSGSFILQHTGVMNRGAAHLTIAVVPDSGNDELVGLTGNMTIDIVEGKHFYKFEYSV